MSITVQKPNLYDPSSIESLLDNPRNESAWLSIFGTENLRNKVCTVIFSERGTMELSKSGSYRSTSYHRRAVASC